MFSENRFWDIVYAESVDKVFAAMHACPFVEQPEIGAHLLFPMIDPDGVTLVLFLIGEWAKPLDLQKRIPELCGKPTLVVYSDRWNPVDFVLNKDKADNLVPLVQGILDEQGISATVSAWDEWSRGGYDQQPSTN